MTTNHQYSPRRALCQSANPFHTMLQSINNANKTLKIASPAGNPRKKNRYGCISMRVYYHTAPNTEYATDNRPVSG